MENIPEVVDEITINPSFGKVLHLFVAHINSLWDTLPLSMKAIVDGLENTKEELNKFREEYTFEQPTESDAIFVHSDKFQEFLDLLKKLNTYSLAMKTVPQSFFVSLISQYDAFLGKLIKQVFLVKPEIHDSTDRNLHLSQLIKFDSISEARNFLLENEIESVIRSSHVDQFKWMEKKFNMPLHKELDAWPIFVEITERRNLFVHTGGVVSDQYLQNCNKHQVKLEENIELGKELFVSPDYFSKAYRVIFEIGLKLTHVFWRKFLPEEIEQSDTNLIQIGYEKLYNKDYELTKMIFEFATYTLKKYSSEENRRLMIVNQALAYKWSDDDEKAKAIINREDWSATKKRFRLAEAVIHDDFSKAIQIMKKIGVDIKEVKKEDYRNWPLFKEIRLQDDFQKTFEEIFNEPFSQIQCNEENVSE